MYTYILIYRDGYGDGYGYEHGQIAHMLTYFTYAASTVQALEWVSEEKRSFIHSGQCTSTEGEMKVALVRYSCNVLV